VGQGRDDGGSLTDELACVVRHGAQIKAPRPYLKKELPQMFRPEGRKDLNYGPLLQVWKGSGCDYQIQLLFVGICPMLIFQVTGIFFLLVFFLNVIIWTSFSNLIISRLQGIQVSSIKFLSFFFILCRPFSSVFLLSSFFLLCC